MNLRTKPTCLTICLLSLSSSSHILANEALVPVLPSIPLLQNASSSSLDDDNDGINNKIDNCPKLANPGQWDTDSDHIGNKCDDDVDGDGFSNELERQAKTDVWDSTSFPSLNSGSDRDKDLIEDEQDNCPDIANNGQWDHDNDQIGNKCDDDIDGDGFSNDVERQAKTDVWDNASFPSLGPDRDGDLIEDEQDNCPDTANNGQWDHDNDQIGNKCDDDIDGDGFSNAVERLAKTNVWDSKSFPKIGPDSDGDLIEDNKDNCPNITNNGQWDEDNDQIGNKCDDDIDGDGFSNTLEKLAKTNPWDPESFPSTGPDRDKDLIEDSQDNCPDIANNGQWDEDNDQIGNKCDDDIDGDGFPNDIEELAKTNPWDASSFPEAISKSAAGHNDSFFISNFATSHNMLSIYQNITQGFGHHFEYEHQISGTYLFAHWGDMIEAGNENFVTNPLGVSQLGIGENGTLYNDELGLNSGRFNHLIISDNWETIPSQWGNTSQYLSRFANYLHQHNPQGQTYLYQNWPEINNADAAAWRLRLDQDAGTWQQIITTVNGETTASADLGSIFYVSEPDSLHPQAKRVKMIPAAFALARLYDAYQANQKPPLGRNFIPEAFKFPDFSFNPDGNGQDYFGKLSPEGEYYLALVMYASVYEVNPIGASNNIAFNGRGNFDYNSWAYPQTPYPNPALIPAEKAAYYQTLAWQVVTEFYGWSSTHGTLDSDGDGVVDGRDVFPNDPTEAFDRDADGWGDNADVFPTDPTLPNENTILAPIVSATLSNGGLNLTWTNGHAATHYRILYWRGNDDPKQVLTTLLSHTLSNIGSSHDLYVLIEAYDDKGNSVFSQAVNVGEL